MTVKIKGREYRLIFGVGFVRALDEKYYIENAAGVRFGVGLSQKIPALLTRSPVVLSEIIYEGTCTEGIRPSQKDVDNFIDNYGDLEPLFDEVISELKKSNVTGSETKEMIAAVEKEEQKRKQRNQSQKRN